MKADADAVSRIAIDHVPFYDDMLSRKRYTQCERVPHGNIGLGAHVKAADADVLRTRDTGCVTAVEAYIDYYSRAIMLAAFVTREILFFILVYHFAPSATWFARRVR